jgi:predicted  nucleic acid-binding Zn-ribbon protein
MTPEELADISDEMDAVCDAAEMEDARAALEAAKADAQETLDEAIEARDQAQAKLTSYQTNLDAQVEACNELLQKPASDGNTGLTCSGGGVTLPCSQEKNEDADAGSYCPVATYPLCFNSGSPTVRDDYAPFVPVPPNPPSIITLYEQRLQATQDLEKLNNDINTANDKISNTDTSQPAVQTEIATLAESYCPVTTPPNPNRAACIAAKRTELTNSYNTRYNEAVAERNNLESQRTAKETALSNLMTDIANKHGAPRDAVPNVACPGRASTILCDRSYQVSCRNIGGAYYLIHQTYAEYSFPSTLPSVSHDLCSLSLPVEECDAPAGYMLQVELIRRQMDVEKAQEAYNEIAAQSISSVDCDSDVGGTGQVVIWTSDGAREVVRRVDKRSVLQ